MPAALAAGDSMLPPPSPPTGEAAGDGKTWPEGVVTIPPMPASPSELGRLTACRAAKLNMPPGGGAGEWNFGEGMDGGFSAGKALVAPAEEKAEEEEVSPVFCSLAAE